jgi:uncharacterized protein YkwD
MALRYAATMVLAVVLAGLAAMGFSAVEPREAEAAGYTVRGCTGTKVTLNVAEYRSLQLHNKARADRGLRRLCVHPALQRAARAHSVSMIRNDYFSHGNFGARLKNHGYRYRTAGENIARGSGSLGAPGPIFRGWMQSPGHRSNILKRGFREVGIGAATGTYKGHKNATMWTADFGTR